LPVLKSSYIYFKSSDMKLPKLTAFSTLFLFTVVLSSCDRDGHADERNVFRKSGLPLNAAQEVPSNPSTAIGLMDVSYDKRTKTLTYSFSWSGLTGPALAAHIHGLAGKGTLALPPPLGRFANGIIQPLWTSPRGTSGTYSGTLLADEVLVKEVDILAGKFYVNIHTQFRPGGEIRGQIEF
jgi:hypothetical protein